MGKGGGGIKIWISCGWERLGDALRTFMINHGRALRGQRIHYK